LSIRNNPDQSSRGRYDPANPIPKLCVNERKVFDLLQKMGWIVMR